jgi:ABC-type branched-subunit amino acid transport system substrate-binding protein
LTGPTATDYNSPGGALLLAHRPTFMEERTMTHPRRRALCGRPTGPRLALAIGLATLLAVALWPVAAPTMQPRLQRPVRLGLLADRTGPLAAYGYAHEKVARAAVGRINEGGGIRGQLVELAAEDTESNPSVATLKARKLIESDGVDFLIGSNTSAVVLAVAPVAKELKTVYFPTAGGALLTTPGKGNRYVFDFNTDVKQETQGVATFVIRDLDVKAWVTVVVDYAWGWDQERSFKDAVEARGGRVLKQVKVPLGSSNWLRSLHGNIPKEAQGVYFANFGTDFLAFIRDLHALRPDLVKVGGNYVLSGQDIGKLGAPAEGVYVVTGYPQEARELDSEPDRLYRKTIGMDEHGREVGTGRRLVPSYQWATWEAIHAIKEVVEESGWTGKSDTPKFILALEQKRFTRSAAHPEGDKHFRDRDHLSLKGAWIEQVQGGRLKVVKRVPPEDLTYPATVNYPQEQPL